MEGYEKRYDYVLLEYYENHYKANMIEVYNNNSPLYPTTVIFRKSGGKLKELPHRELTTLGLFRYLKEGKRYKIDEVKKMIKEMEGEKNYG